MQTSNKISSDGGEAAYTGGDDFLIHPLIVPLKPRKLLVSL
jgi:hypothetical protein